MQQIPPTLLILQPLHPAHANSTHRSKPSIKGVAVAPTGVSQPHTAPVTQGFFTHPLSKAAVSALVHPMEEDGFGDTLNCRKK